MQPHGNLFNNHLVRNWEWCSMTLVAIWVRNISWRVAQQWVTARFNADQKMPGEGSKTMVDVVYNHYNWRFASCSYLDIGKLL